MVFDEKLLTELQIKGVFAANSVLLKNFITGDNDPVLLKKWTLRKSGENDGTVI